MIEILNWVTQDGIHLLGTIFVLGFFGDWCIRMVKAWKGHGDA